ncbi:MAG: type II toxin-antitoxin system RelE/ParE family toxin [Elusimicrobiota bacterium]
MAKKIIWSSEAVADLESLAEYIGRDSLYYASSFVQEIIELSKGLNEFHKRGRVVPELGDVNVRELFIKEYRLMYSVQKSQIVIVGIIHGKRDLNKLWKKGK